jgi:hypothetical protein
MSLRRLCATLMIALALAASQAVWHARGAATLLPPGESCFSATTSTSGGGVGVITGLGAISAGGSLYTTGIYANVSLTGGSGYGAVATIQVAGGVVSAVVLQNGGFHYQAADSLSAASANIGGTGSGFAIPVASIQGAGTGTGMIGTLGTIVPGTGGTSGSYGGVTVAGGSGSGATANVTVSGGGVTQFVILNPGTGYVVGDVLTVLSGAIGGTTGFTVPILSVSVNSALAGGSVTFYIPNSQTFKQTWQNAAQTILNQNPVPLDANGCATIYGSGIYRQILKDSLGNIIWDRTTADTTGGNNTFWAGQAGGTANAITVTDTSFSGVDGSVIQFLPLLNNTGAVTLNPSAYFVSAPAIVKDTSSGPVALTGSPAEIVASPTPNVVSVVWSATEGNFHLLNTAIQTAGATAAVPLCGASGLKITNGATPTAIAAITARQATMTTSTGLFVTRSNVSVTVNIGSGNATPAAGGMDGEAPGTSAWVDLFVIDTGGATSGTNPSGLGSLAAGNGLAPALPTGYAYSCYLGAMFVDGSGNLLKTIQVGPRAQYQTTSIALPAIASTTGTPAAFGSAWTAHAISGFVPPTAVRIITQI